MCSWSFTTTTYSNEESTQASSNHGGGSSDLYVFPALLSLSSSIKLLAAVAASAGPAGMLLLQEQEGLKQGTASTAVKSVTSAGSCSHPCTVRLECDPYNAILANCSTGQNGKYSFQPYRLASSKIEYFRNVKNSHIWFGEKCPFSTSGTSEAERRGRAILGVDIHMKRIWFTRLIARSSSLVMSLIVIIRCLNMINC